MNYFALEGEKRQVLNLETVLLLKNGFVRISAKTIVFNINF